MDYEEPKKMTSYTVSKKKKTFTIEFPKEPKMVDTRGREVDLASVDERDFLFYLLELITFYYRKRTLRKR